MTCIAGIVHDGRVLIGGDAIGVSGWSSTVRNDPKVWAADGWAFGYSGSYRVAQLLRWSFDRPQRIGQPIQPAPIEQYLATAFTDAYREVLRKGGSLKASDGVEAAADQATIMIGHEGRLFVIYSDFQVAEPADGFAAIGSGEAIACGALYATRTMRNPRRRVTTALEAAERFNIGVRGPFTIVEAT